MPDRARGALSRYLDRLLLRAELGEAEQQAILELPGKATLVDVTHDFVHVGEPLDHACLIVDGLVARFAQLRNGLRSTVALHIPGDMADLHSVVSPKVTWALHAVTPSTILRVPHSALLDLCARFPTIAVAFWQDCVVDANVLAQWAVNAGRKDAAGRVAHLLCELYMRYRAIGLATDGKFQLPITQANLADAVGLTPVHLNRVLMRLKASGILVKFGLDIEIGDFKRLADVGEFDPSYLELLRQS